MRISRRRGVVAVSSLFLALSAIGYGCGGDDSNGSGDDNGNDSGPAPDGTTGPDGSLPQDGSTPSDGAVTDAAHDAGPPHVVFVTSTMYTGNLIDEATAIESDAGLDAGLSDDAGDGGTSYLAATDIICNRVAKSAGLSGKFAALISAGTNHVMSRFTDADGPWALVTGAPVADKVADLASGEWRAAIDVTELGTDLHNNDDGPWASGVTTADCGGWSSASAASNGVTGSNPYTSHFGLNDSTDACNTAHPIYCAEVGTGGGPNREPAVPAGGKIAFAIPGSFPGNFALPDAGVLDAAAPDAGDNVHSVGDAICNEVARGFGRAGKFHGWLSSTNANAKTFFTSLSMNGPWYRADGEEIAATLTELTTTGVRTQLETDPNGALIPDPGALFWTGTSLPGTLPPNDNCVDYTSNSGADFSTGARSAYRLDQWTGGNSLLCNQFNGLYCFEE